MEHVIDIQHLSKSFGAHEVLKDIKADKTANSAVKKLYSDFEKFNFDDYLDELDKLKEGE